PKTKNNDDESENTIESSQTTPSEAKEQQIQVEEPPKVYPVQSGSNSNYEEIISEIEENLKNKLTIEELDIQTQTDYQNIKDSKDNKMNENISKQGAKKRIEKLRKKATANSLQLQHVSYALVEIAETVSFFKEERIKTQHMAYIKHESLKANASW
ncbi:14689_t:CDS:2, partial [Funneliformis mosseae]